mgnify:CR=1 FL=1
MGQRGKESLRNFRLQENNIEREHIYKFLCLTPIEHGLIGSSMEGKGFHPNKPIGLYAHLSLEQINQMRNTLNKEQDPNNTFQTPLGADDVLYAHFTLRQLSQDDIELSDWVPTFDLHDAHNIDDEDIAKEQALEQFYKKVMDIQQETRQQLKEGDALT